jgi:hypothetical protein
VEQEGLGHLMQMDKVQVVQHRIGETFHPARGMGGKSAYHEDELKKY